MQTEQTEQSFSIFFFPVSLSSFLQVLFSWNFSGVFLHLIDKQIKRFQITMHNWRLARVQIKHSLCAIGRHAEFDGPRQIRSGLFLKQQKKDKKKRERLDQREDKHGTRKCCTTCYCCFRSLFSVYESNSNSLVWSCHFVVLYRQLLISWFECSGEKFRTSLRFSVFFQIYLENCSDVSSRAELCENAHFVAVRGDPDEGDDFRVHQFAEKT